MPAVSVASSTQATISVSIAAPGETPGGTGRAWVLTGGRIRTYCAWAPGSTPAFVVHSAGSPSRHPAQCPQGGWGSRVTD